MWGKKLPVKMLSVKNDSGQIEVNSPKHPNTTANVVRKFLRFHAFLGKSFSIGVKFFILRSRKNFLPGVGRKETVGKIH